ncbi:hypothetical protein MMC16_007179 [Acarospora aff. strigata]|nr:hypothetical protein [Acarospora aff. strigata]
MAPQTRQTEQDQRTAEARTAFTASLSSVGTSLDTDLRSRAAVLHSNAAALSKQEADLAKETAALAKQSSRWQKMADTSQTKLKEIGDVQNWAEMIERDLLVIEETLRMVEDDDPNNTQDMNGHSTSGRNGWF